MPYACKILVGFSFALLSWGAFAETQLRTLIMETEPWGFHDPHTGQLQGIWLDIAEELEMATGISQEKKLAPYARVMESLALGDADLSYLIRSPDRDAEVVHAGRLFDFGSVIQAHPEVSLETYDDLQGLKIGVLQGIRLSPRFDLDQQLYKIPVRNYETMLTMLAAGRLDAVSGNSLSLAYLQEQMQMQDDMGDRLVLQVTPVTVQLSNESPHLDLVPVITKAVEHLRETGRIQNILDSWAGKRWRVSKEGGVE
jgi:polar amino acid transport system substrate-binding protein